MGGGAGPPARSHHFFPKHGGTKLPTEGFGPAPPWPVVGGATDSEAASMEEGSAEAGWKEEFDEELKRVRAGIEEDLRDKLSEEVRLTRAGIEAELSKKFSEELGLARAGIEALENRFREELLVTKAGIEAELGEKFNEETGLTRSGIEATLDKRISEAMAVLGEQFGDEVESCKADVQQELAAKCGELLVIAGRNDGRVQKVEDNVEALAVMAKGMAKAFVGMESYDGGHEGILASLALRVAALEQKPAELRH